MPSQYLQPGDYANYGVPNATSAQVLMASTYIDAHLKRPEGLVWSPDSTGNPAYMAAPNPSISFTLGTSIAPGANVVANVTGGPIKSLNTGDILIVDRATGNLAEALTVVSNINGQVTFQNVLNAHALGASLDADMCITERRFMPKNRPIIVLGRTPIQRIMSGIGRYAYQRRGDSHGGNTDDYNLLAVYTQFGGPPVWELFNTQQSTEFDPRTGQIWVPAGIMLAYYSEVQIRYVAGFAQANIPSEVKLVCAKLIQAMQNDPNLGPVRSYRAGDTQVEKFADTIIAGDLAGFLRPYRINGLV